MEFFLNNTRTKRGRWKRKREAGRERERGTYLLFPSRFLPNPVMHKALSFLISPTHAQFVTTMEKHSQGHEHGSLTRRAVSHRPRPLRVHGSSNAPHSTLSCKLITVHPARKTHPRSIMRLRFTHIPPLNMPLAVTHTLRPGPSLTLQFSPTGRFSEPISPIPRSHCHNINFLDHSCPLRGLPSSHPKCRLWLELKSAVTRKSSSSHTVLAAESQHLEDAAEARKDSWSFDPVACGKCSPASEKPSRRKLRYQRRHLPGFSGNCRLVRVVSKFSPGGSLRSRRKGVISGSS